MEHALELSIMAESAGHIQPLLDQFTAEQGIPVRLRLLDWDKAWSDLVKVGLYGDGPDVSEIGSTWVGDLVAMNALHPFDENELALLGTPDAFLPTTWQGAHLIGQTQPWAIPWLTGVRLLFFRRQLLQQAGIEEATAFQTAEQLDRTLGRLQAAGIGVPWTVPTGTTHTTLLNIASWVWGAGGDFITPDGKRTLFSQARARSGIRAYFALARYLAPPVRHLTRLQPDEQFLRHADTAMTLSGAWLFEAVRDRGTPDLATQLGVALPPGVPFVGGSYLGVWKHSRQPDAALQLIRFLTQTPAQVTYSQRMGLLPATIAALAAPPFGDDPLWQLAIQGLQTGRSFPVTRSWGLLEYRLVATLNSLWAETLARPDQDLDAAITKHLEPLARRLDPVLEQS
ncbi:MAG TPA: extracellular solute-binding protein [Chloroflexia bacterium]|nr:extracellular solute-binding protein [Chloroflexia bacterium]